MNGHRTPHLGATAGSAAADRVAAELARLAVDGVGILHRRRMPRGTGTADYLAITPGAIWVVSTPTCPGRPQRRIEGRSARHRVEKLVVGGQDETPLLDDVQAQINQVEAPFPELPVRGAVCLTDADRCLFGARFSVRGVDIVGPGKLAKLLRSTSAGAIDVVRATSLLGHAFPAA